MRTHNLFLSSTTAVALSSLALAQHVHSTLVGAPNDGLGWSIASTADTDGDGVRDLIVSGNASLRVVSGASSAALVDIDPIWPFSLVPTRRVVAGIDDIDGDGAGDVLAADPTASTASLKSGIARAYSGRTGALLLEVVPPLVNHKIGESIDGLGDVDGDHVPDFVVGGRDAMNVGIVRVHSGADGHVIHTVSTGGSGQVGVARAGDLDADGVEDFVAGSGGAGSLRAFSGANGGQLFAVTLPGGYTRIAGVGDIDGDGHADFVTANELMPSMPARLISGANGSELRAFVPAADSVARVGDLDGDGKSDVALLGRAEGVGAPKGAPRGVVVSSVTGAVLARIAGRNERDFFGLPARLVVCDLGDVNGDGASDFAVAQGSYDSESGAGPRGKLWIYDSLASTSAGASFGTGDGSGAPCPCGNTAPNAGAGCANSTGFGALLAAHGSTSVTADDLVLDITNVRRDVLCTLAFGSIVAPGQGPIVGAGRRVIAGPVMRLQTNFTAFDGAATSGTELSRLGLWSAGQTVYFQAAYRDAAGPCGASLNLTNGLQVTFTP